ncbi:hypothetical protein F5Y01DRAFT_299702 [Xylaria sp. FL0043]|nr:hypothetical protein F5Y01DRAFT_299702 [Xylaria sp. FL0043]
MLISSTISRLRPLKVRAVANDGLICSTPSSLRLRHPAQIRAFRFGMWSSYLDPAYDRELRRRCRTFKHKYADYINRNLSWHETLLAEHAKLALKRAMARSWVSPPNISRSVNRDEPDNRTKASPRPPKTASTKDAFLFKNSWSWESQRDEVFGSPSTKTPRGVGFPSRTEIKSERPHVNNHATDPEPRETLRSQTNYTESQDYVIDPITNRKTPRGERRAMEMDSEPLTRTLETGDSQFAPFSPPSAEEERQPIYSNGKPPASELNKYTENNFDDWPEASTTAGATGPIESSVHPEIAPVSDSSTLRNEEYSLNHLPLDDPVEDPEDLHEGPTVTPDKPVEGSPDSLKHRHAVVKSGRQRLDRFKETARPGGRPREIVDELRNYGPYMHNEDPPANAESVDIEELEKYKFQASAEPGSSTEPDTVYHDLHEYIPTAPEATKDQSQPFEKYGGLEEYKAFRRQHLDKTDTVERQSATENMKEQEPKEVDIEIPGFNTCVGDVPKKIPKMKLPEGVILKNSFFRRESEALRQGTERLNGKFHEIDLEYLQRTGDSHGIERMSTASSADSKEAQPHDEQRRIHTTEKKQPESSRSIERTIPSPTQGTLSHTSRLEPALNRRLSAMKGNTLNRAFGSDLYSKEPQGLETSFYDECGGRHTMPLYRRTYGSEPGQVMSKSEPTTESDTREFPESSPESYPHRDPEIDGIPRQESMGQEHDQKAAQPDEPTVYKILAYDPTMQTINVAETTSVVPDLAAPLSPSEVLLRLSNPTKFFPHFAPLQAEGFEIVSGGGDLLVFRQVRPAKAAAQGGTASVNPIDMMGRSAAVPNAAAFVSPTGFVNYDIPRVEEESPESPFRSNINVRREEPVFSGQKSSSRNQEKKKGKKSRSVGERALIGGAWVAGISYALGVVSEYFLTGGTDGKGPTGFSPI